MILTDKGLATDSDSIPHFSKAIAITSENMLCEVDRQGNPIDDGIHLQEITVIEWGTIKPGVAGMLIGVVSFLIGIIGLMLLPSNSSVIDALEATLCLLATVLIWTSRKASYQTYLLCKGEQVNVMLILRAPMEYAAQGILTFIKEIDKFDETLKSAHHDEK